MPRFIGAPLLLCGLLLLCLTAQLCSSSSLADERCEEVLPAPAGVAHMFRCRPSSPIWQVHHMWSLVSVKLAACDDPAAGKYDVYAAASEAAVMDQVRGGARPHMMHCGRECGGWTCPSKWRRDDQCAVSLHRHETVVFVVQRLDLQGHRTICGREESQSFRLENAVVAGVGVILCLLSAYLSTCPGTCWKLCLICGTATAIFIFNYLELPILVPSLPRLFLGYCTAMVALVLTSMMLGTVFMEWALRGVGLAFIYFATNSQPDCVMLVLLAAAPLYMWLWSWYRSCGRFGLDVAAGGHRAPGPDPHPLVPEASTHSNPTAAPPAPACSSSSAFLDRNNATLPTRTPSETSADLNATRRASPMDSPIPSTTLAFSAYHTATASMAPGDGLDDGAESADMRHPLVRQGSILNGLTGEHIKIGSRKFDNLEKDGHTPDYVLGMMLPPGGVANLAGP